MNFIIGLLLATTVTFPVSCDNQTSSVEKGVEATFDFVWDDDLLTMKTISNEIITHVKVFDGAVVEYESTCGSTECEDDLSGLSSGTYVFWAYTANDAGRTGVIIP